MPFDRQHQEIIAGRAEEREKVGISSDRVALAADQAHRAVAALTMKRRRTFLLASDDLPHPQKRRAHPRAVNSVSLQPLFARTNAIVQAHPVAMAWAPHAFGILELIEPSAVKEALASL